MSFVLTPAYDATLAAFQAEHGERLPGDLGEPEALTHPGTPLLDEVAADGIKVRGVRKQITARPAKKAAPGSTRKPRARR